VSKLGHRVGFERTALPDLGLIYYFLAADAKDAPLIISIQGSGCDSVFERDEKGRVFGGTEVEIADIVGSKAAILTVEKPHVETFFKSTSRGDDTGCSSEFRRDFVRDRWLAQLKNALSDVMRTRSLRPKRIIVLGHSEGAEVAAFLAEEVPQIT